jgi:hypothetical protein
MSIDKSGMELARMISVLSKDPSTFEYSGTMLAEAGVEVLYE